MQAEAHMHIRPFGHPTSSTRISGSLNRSARQLGTAEKHATAGMAPRAKPDTPGQPAQPRPLADAPMHGHRGGRRRGQWQDPGASGQAGKGGC